MDKWHMQLPRESDFGIILSIFIMEFRVEAVRNRVMEHRMQRNMYENAPTLGTVHKAP